MIRFTHCIHGGGTVSRMLRHKNSSFQELPEGLLPYTSVIKPVVFWNITARCNLSCDHCYLSAGRLRTGDRELTSPEAFTLLDDLSNLGIPLLIISGGEPLMRDDVWELLTYAQKKRITTALSSNGTLINREIADRLKASGVGYVGISLDSADRKTHERFRHATGCYDAALAGLAHCHDAGLKTGVRCTATRDNYRHIEPLIQLSRRMNVDRFCVYWLVPSGRGNEIYDEMRLTPGDSRGILDLLYRYTCETDPENMEFLTVDAPQDLVYLLERLRTDDPTAYENALTLVQCQTAGCSAGFRVASIDPSGNVYPCQFAQRAPFLVGNIRHRPFSELWNDTEHPVLQGFRTNADNLTGPCRECRHRAICGGGCRIRAYHATGDIRGSDPFCDQFTPLSPSHISAPPDRNGNLK